MSLVILLAGGFFCGIVAAAPLLLQLGRPHPSLVRGIVAVLVAFLMIQLAMLGVRVAWPEVFVPFGVTATLTFLTATIIAALR